MERCCPTITVMALAAANTLGISVDIPTAVILSVLAAVSACGASGVAGGSLPLIPWLARCSAFRTTSRCRLSALASSSALFRTLRDCLNSASDVMFTAASEFRNMAKAGQTVDPKTWDK